MNVIAVSTAAVLVACLTSVRADAAEPPAQGTVVGAAMPGTMEDTFTVPYTEYDATAASGCGTAYAGCTGEFFELSHEIAGSITVLDDCTFRIQGWQFDGLGPAVEWWGSMQEGSPMEFPYPVNAIKIGELGAPGSYQTGSDHGGDSDVVVRLGLDEAGNQIEFSDMLNHISVWCEDFAVDFGNAPLMCDSIAPGAVAPGAEAPLAEAPGPVAPVAVAPTPVGEPAAAPAPGPAVVGAPITPAAPVTPGTPPATPETPAATPATPAAPATPAGTETGSGSGVATPTPSEAFPMHSAVSTLAAIGTLGLALL